MICEGALDHLPAGIGQVYHPRTAVRGVRTALYQPLSLQPVHCRRNRAAGKVNQRADRIHRSRTLVQQRFQHREIGESQSERMYMPDGVPPDRFVGLPQHQPKVNSAGFHRACLRGYHYSFRPKYTLAIKDETVLDLPRQKHFKSMINPLKKKAQIPLFSVTV